LAVRAAPRPTGISSLLRWAGGSPCKPKTLQESSLEILFVPPRRIRNVK
jgi:hypothetical protein